jgi:alkaline phosphatase
LPRGAKTSEAAGAVEQGYDPTTRWLAFENAMFNDFVDTGSYTSYTDSAAAGTALMSGRKTSVGRLNMDWSASTSFTTIAEHAIEHGLAAGVVSSVMISHATPAAAIAKNISRNNYAEIFQQMFDSELTVLMGAGHPLYDSSGNLLDTDKQDFKYLGGEALFTSMAAMQGDDTVFIDTVDAFAELATGRALPQRVIGIPRSGATLQAVREGLPTANTPSGMAFVDNVPSLSTMSQGALNVLAQDQDGFFVMIEGGAIDWMGHANNMPRFIEEQIAFNDAVSAVIEWVETNSSWEETLLIITSDHECGGIWGEGTWTNSIGGPVSNERSDDAIKAARFNPSEDTFNAFLAVQDNGVGNLPGYMFASGNHTNDLVPLYALGAGSERLAEFTRTDLKAAQLWGEQFNWNGQFVDITAVFEVMQGKLAQ